jgi:hypothetical protein
LVTAAALVTAALVTAGALVTAASASISLSFFCKASRALAWAGVSTVAAACTLKAAMAKQTANKHFRIGIWIF